MLAGLFKAPTKYAPHVNLPAARARANDVLNNLVDAGYMTEGQVYAGPRATRRRRSTARATSRPTGTSTTPTTRSASWPRPASSATTAC